MEGFNLESLLNVGTDVTSNLEIVAELGTFKIDGARVRRQDNLTLGTNSVIFPLMINGTQAMKDGQPVFKYANIRSTSSLDAPEYRIYAAKLKADFKNDNGEFNKNAKGEEVGKAGEVRFYAESIGGTPRPAAQTSAALTDDKPVF